MPDLPILSGAFQFSDDDTVALDLHDFQRLALVYEIALGDDVQSGRAYLCDAGRAQMGHAHPFFADVFLHGLGSAKAQLLIEAAPKNEKLACAALRETLSIRISPSVLISKGAEERESEKSAGTLPDWDPAEGGNIRAMIGRMIKTIQMDKGENAIMKCP